MPISLDNFPSYRPFTNITPFTIRDGATYLLQLEAIKDWLRDYVIPLINSEVGELTENWEAQVLALIENWERLSVELIDTVNNVATGVADDADAAEAAKLAAEAARDLAELYAGQAAGLQDAAMTAVLNSVSSDFRQLAETLFASVDGLDAVAQRVTTAEGTLADHGLAIDSLNTLTDTGRLGQDDLDARYVNESDYEDGIEDLTDELSKLAINPGSSVAGSPAPQFGATTIVLSGEDMVTGTGLTSVYVPVVIETTGVIANPLGRFYAYWSTNHSTGAGGIGLAYADDIDGPWTVYGNIYHDDVEGDQTETPWVVARGVGDLIMYYQNNITDNHQYTYYAKSSDGINWIRAGRALIPEYSLGSIHSGYAKVYKRGRYGYTAMSLNNGGDSGRHSLWYSYDGEDWYQDLRISSKNVDVAAGIGIPDFGLRSVSFAPTIFDWKGQVWGFYSFSTPASGTSTPAYTTLYISRVSENLRTPIGGFTRITGSSSCVLEVDGRLLAFGGGESTGLFYREII